ncbi:30S ribosomal protein S20 [Patescibacteria group bacterium]|nr:30S ribosomal protein S20 [Patescibacteria group bacterium]
MPIGLSAKKSLRKSIKNHKANVVFKSKVHGETKSFLAKPSVDGLKKLYSILDKAVKKHLIHANKAARLKAQFSKKVSKSAPEAGSSKTKAKSTKKMS